jgi:hypothetical protein
MSDAMDVFKYYYYCCSHCSNGNHPTRGNEHEFPCPEIGCQAGRKVTLTKQQREHHFVEGKCSCEVNKSSKKEV